MHHFKSIAKNCKAFDVEGSLGVLEKDLNETPNVFTEVMKQLAELKKVRQDIIDDALRSFSRQMTSELRQIVGDYKRYPVAVSENWRYVLSLGYAL